MTVELAKRAVACKGWRWMRGMSSLYPPPGSDTVIVSGDHVYVMSPGAGDDQLPDLSDPATLGCLLHLVREAWGDPLLYAENVDEGSEWCVRVNAPKHPEAPTEAEVLVAALEAAP